MTKQYKTVTSDGKVKLSMNIDKTLIQKIDIDCELKRIRRSDWITIASMYYLQKEDRDNITKK
jgi:metal-responsive CopG/Arc/MetJ family transcriptional regulator